MVEKREDKLTRWARRVSEDEMPIFGRTVQQVVSVAEDDEAPVAQLARVVLEDASMTARVLKLANTIFYNPRGQGISTVSRALMLLGFNTVRTMCLSISLIDSFVQGASREQLTHELARSIHAAVQARTIAIERKDPFPEEVFVATLLYRLGELAFWCFGGESADQLDALLRQPDLSEEEAEEQLLGFKLRQLTLKLAQEWRVNELLVETLRHPERAGGRGRSILLGVELAAAAEQGWNSPRVQAIGKEVAEQTGLSKKVTMDTLHSNAREAARIASAYGATTAARTIPLPGGQPEEFLEEEPLEVTEYPEPDGMLQLRILRELSQMLEGKADFNLLMELVLEGIYRGSGMDRTLFALLSPDRKGIRAKYALGPDRDRLAARFQFVRDPQQPDILFYTLEKQGAVWVDTAQEPALGRLLPDILTAVVGKRPFLLAPIVINDKTIGLFYADRALSGRALDEESFESFKHFVMQANMGLTHVARQGK